MLVDFGVVVSLGATALFALWLAVTAFLAYFRLSEKYDSLRDEQRNKDSRIESLLRNLARATHSDIHIEDSGSECGSASASECGSEADSASDSDSASASASGVESVSESESQLEECWLAFNRPSEVSRENEFDMPSVYSTWVVVGSSLDLFLAGFERTFPDHSHFVKKPDDDLADVEPDDLIVWDLRHLADSPDEASLFVVQIGDLKKFRHAFWLDESQTSPVEDIEHLVGVIAPIKNLETLAGIRDQDLLTIPSYLANETLRKKAVAAWTEHGATHYARMPDEGLVVLGESLPASD